MLSESFENVYGKFQLRFYRKIFDRVKEREGSLSAMEAFSVEVIKMLGTPTVSEFAAFLNISQSNATYKVNSLIRKGYIEREQSKNDGREYHLVLSEKFHNYVSLHSDYEKVVMSRIQSRFSKEDLEKLDTMLRIIARELMPECD